MKRYIRVCVCLCFIFVFFLGIFVASVRPDIINSVCDDNDGCDRRYGVAIGRGRHRLTVSDIFDITHEFLRHSGLSSSPRILVYRPRNHLSFVHPVYVLASYFVLDHQFERCVLGHARSCSQENEEGLWVKEIRGGGRSGILSLQ